MSENQQLPSFLGVDIVETATNAILSKPGNKEAAKRISARCKFYAGVIGKINLADGGTKLVNSVDGKTNAHFSPTESQKMVDDLKLLPDTLLKISAFIDSKVK